MKWELWVRFAAVLVGAAVLGSGAGVVEAQPKAAPAKVSQPKAAATKELEEAERLSMEGEKLRKEGKYDAALPLAERALAIREKALGSEHPDVAKSLNNLALVYRDMGEYARALPLHLRALAIREKALGSEHPDVAISLGSLANVYYTMGKYARALPLHLRALAIREKALGSEHPDVAISLGSLAIVYNSMGEYARALPLHLRALAIREKALGSEHPNVAISLHNLASVYYYMGEYAQALPLHLRALAIREKALGSEHPYVAASLHNLANVYYDMGEYARALPLRQRALSIGEKALGSEHPYVTIALISLADGYRGQGDLTQAAPFYQRALAIREKALDPDHPDVALSLDGLAALAEARRDFSGALPFAERAAEIREKNLRQILPTGAETHKRDNLAHIAEDVDHNLWRAIHAESPKATQLALTTLLRRKGRALDATAESVRLLRARLGPDEQKLFDDLLSIRSRRSALVLRGPDLMPVDQHKTLLAELLVKDQQLDEQISQKSDAFRASEQPITLGAVKAALPAGSALVEWSVYRPFNPRDVREEGKFGIPRYGACIQKTQGEPSCIDLGEAAAIDASVTRLRRSLGRTSSPNAKVLARDLHQKVMVPIQKILGETRWVFLSPDGALNLIPFAALVDEDGHFLLENYALTYLTSGRDLIRLANAPKPPARDKPAIVAAPNFDAAEAAAPAAPKRDNPPDGERGTRSTDLGSLTFSPLLGAEQEARTLAGALGDTRLFLGSEATETALKALRGPSLLHIATHGFFLPDQKKIEGKAEREDPLLRSGLALAGANGRKSGNEDGVLTALEVTGEDLYGTELVVLSACETGLGDVQNGDGVYGLRRALVVSGARTQVMSLWKVDDQATVELMKAYYARLKAGEGRSEAMREVQLSMLSQGERTSPHYWASFIVSGDWNALSGKAMVPDFGRVPPSPRGCACEQAGAPESNRAAWMAIVILGAGLARRRLRSWRITAGVDECKEATHQAGESRCETEAVNRSWIGKAIGCSRRVEG